MADAVLHLSIPVRDLAEARAFYEGALGCEVGRVRDSWLDVWFFGLQLTLQERPDEVAGLDGQGVRHFGVALEDAHAFEALVTRVNAHHVTWLAEPAIHTAVDLSGKVGGKLADPSGNVIEVKYYDDPAELHGQSVPSETSGAPSLTLAVQAGELAVVRLAPDAPVPAWLPAAGFTTVSRTADELSVLCAASAVPALAPDVPVERGWVGLKLQGPFAFTLTGILAAVLVPLADAAMGIFAVSTFDTDYVLVKEHQLDDAIAALRSAGHSVSR